jgi:hypothetical protein
LGIGGSKRANLLLGDAEYPLPAAGGVVSSIYFVKDVGVYVSDHLSSILNIKKIDGAIEVTVQAVNAGTIKVYRSEAGSKVLSADVTGPGIHVLKVKTE